MRTHLAALVAVSMCAAAAGAQADRAALVARLDSIAGSAVAQNRAVGLVAAVVRGSDTLLLKSYGKADVEWNVPMPADAMFEIGSIAKQFTAVAILQLRDAGRLSLDDDVTKWLPDFDARGHEVSLRRLLDHTAGVHDFTETPEFRSLVSNRVFPRDSAYALVQRYPFDFPPGERQLYSNSGFFLLALVVEKASGVSYEDYVEKKLFEPLGMKGSMYCNSMENVPRRAHGYGLQNGLWRMPTNVQTWALGAGALCSTAADLVAWLKALHGGRVLSPRSYAEMMTPSTLGNGMKLRYGLGVAVYRDARGLDIVEHGGIVAGFRSEARWYPEAKAAVVVLTNTTGGIDPEDMIARELGAALIPARSLTKVFAGDPAPLVGRYAGRGTGQDLVVEVTHGPQGLMVSGNGSPPRPLPWIEGRTFVFNNIYLAFGRPGDPGPATELGFNPAKGLMFVLKRQ